MHAHVKPQMVLDVACIAASSTLQSGPVEWIVATAHDAGFDGLHLGPCPLLSMEEQKSFPQEAMLSMSERALCGCAVQALPKPSQAKHGFDAIRRVINMHTPTDPRRLKSNFPGAMWIALDGVQPLGYYVSHEIPPLFFVHKLKCIPF